MIQKVGCPYCGTEWVFDTSGGRRQGGMSGFIMSTINTHWFWCKDWTPEQRLAFIIRNEKRLSKKQNLHTQVHFNKSHKGVAKHL